MMPLLLFDRDTLFNISSFVDHILVLLKVKERSFDNVGMSFLWVQENDCLLSDFKAYIADCHWKQCNREKNFFMMYSLF
jgi:hypothetical protein